MEYEQDEKSLIRPIRRVSLLKQYLRHSVLPVVSKSAAGVYLYINKNDNAGLKRAEKNPEAHGQEQAIVFHRRFLLRAKVYKFPHNPIVA